jgi:uncharacterized protein YkwD
MRRVLWLTSFFLVACAQATSAPTQIIFITPTKGTAIQNTEAPLPFRNLVTPSPTVTRTFTPAPATATSRVIASAPATVSPRQLQPTAIAAPPSTDVSSAESNVINLINANRLTQGLPPLGRNESVRQIARARSADMVARDYFSHNDPVTGASLAKPRVLAAGFNNSGENIFWSGQFTLVQFPTEAVQWFMTSAPHRANILGSGYTAVGAGIIWNGLGWVLTVVFAG